MPDITKFATPLHFVDRTNSVANLQITDGIQKKNRGINYMNQIPKMSESI